MSRYAYESPLTPSRATGWRSAFTSTLTVGMIVAVSAISGAVVTLDLLGSASTSDERPAIAATKAPPAPVRTARAVTPIFAQPVSLPAIAAAAVAQPPTPATTASLPPTAPQAVPAVASVDEPAAALPDSQLTFTNGYARRRALQQAAASSAKIEVARAESENQMGRAAKAKPKTVARQQDQRHDENGPFARFDPPSRSDAAHRQTLAYGDQRDPRASRRPSSQGGLFGGFFGGMF